VKCPAIKPHGIENTCEIEKDFKFQGYIEGEEHRGITLAQLKHIVDWSEVQCWKWRESLLKGRTVPAPTPEELTFQLLVKWLVSPATGLREGLLYPCAFVELLTDQRQTPVWFVSHPWSGMLADFFKSVEAHYRSRAITSYFAESPYWVSAFAVREQAQENEFKAGPENAGFYKAIHLCKGMLLLLGSTVKDSISPFKRMWCALEVSVASDCAIKRGEFLLLDMAVRHNNKTEVLTAGMTEKEIEMEEQRAGTGTWAKECREKDFPLEILSEGLGVKFEEMGLNETEYTKDMTKFPSENDPPGTKVKMWTEKFVTDYRSELLKYVCGLDMASKGAPPPQHENYDALNRKLRAEFALVTWRRALLQGPTVVESMGLPGVLRADVDRELLILDYFGVEEIGDKEIVSIAKGLPPGLKQVELKFKRCRAINDRGVMALGAGLPTGMQSLFWDFSHCGVLSDASLTSLAGKLPPCLHTLRLRFKGVKGSITDNGLEVLSNALPPSMKMLEFDFAKCEGIGQKGIDALSAKLPRDLQTLLLDFWMCGAINNDGGLYSPGGIQMLSKFLPATLDSLQLRFTGVHGDFSDKGVQCISTGLPRTLQVLKLDLLYLDRLSDIAMDTLGQHLPPTLHTFELKLDGCDRITDAGLSFVCDKMPPALHTLVLHCEFCGQITSKGVSDMAERLPASLRSLSLNFASCKEIKDNGLIALAEKLPRSLQKLHLDLKYCKKVGDHGVAALGKHLPGSLTDISLQFGNCELIYDAGIVALAEGLPQSVEWLEINLWCCKNVGDTGVMYIAKHFPPSCKVLLLNVDGTKVSPDKRSFCTGIESMRRCSPTALELMAPPSQPDRTLHNDSRIGWLRRHGPRLKSVDDALERGDPVLEPVSSFLLSKLDSMTPKSQRSMGSTMGSTMSKSTSLPCLVRKKQPVSPLVRPNRPGRLTVANLRFTASGADVTP